MSKFYGLALATLCVCISLPVQADHLSIGSLTGGSGPINTVSGATLPAGFITGSISTEFVKSDEYSDKALVSFATRHIHAHSSDYTMTTAIGAAYGITDDLMISARLPYIYRENIRSGAHSHVGGLTINEVDDHGDSGAMGDLFVLGKYRFLNRDSWQAAAMLGIEVPTGEKSATHDGAKLETEHQGGSGSWDPSFGLAVSKAYGAFSFDVSGLYLIARKGSQNVDLGDRANYGVAVSYRIGGEQHDHGKGVIHQHQAWDLVLELNGEWYGKQEANDRADKDSGGIQTFVSPGLRYTSDDNWSGHVSLGVPIQDDLRRGHSDTEYKITAGLSKAF